MSLLNPSRVICLIPQLRSLPNFTIPRTSSRFLLIPNCQYSSKAKSGKSSSSTRWLQRQGSDQYTREAKFNNFKSRAAFKLLQINETFKLLKKNKVQNVLDLGAAPGAWNQVSVEKCHSDSKILGVDILVYTPPTGVSSMQANILSKKTHQSIREFFKIANKERKLESKHLKDIQTSSGMIDSISDASMIASELEKSSPSPSSIRKSKENLIASDTERPIDIVLSDMYVPFLQISGYHSRTTNNPYLRMANMTGIYTKDHLMSMDLCDAALIVCCDLLKKGGAAVMKFFTGEEDKFLETRLKKVFKKVIRYKPKATRDESRECYFVCLDKRQDVVDKLEVFKVA